MCRRRGIQVHTPTVSGMESRAAVWMLLTFITVGRRRLMENMPPLLNARSAAVAFPKDARGSPMGWSVEQISVSLLISTSVSDELRAS